MNQISKQQLVSELLSCDHDHIVILDTQDLTSFLHAHLKSSIHLPLTACLERKQPQFILKFINKETVAKMQNKDNKVILIKNGNKNLFRNFCDKLSAIFDDVSNIYIYTPELNDMSPTDNLDNDDNTTITSNVKLDYTINDNNKDIFVGFSDVLVDRENIIKPHMTLRKKASHSFTFARGITQLNDWLFITNAGSITNINDTINSNNINAIDNSDDSSESDNNSDNDNGSGNDDVNELTALGIEAIINCASECSDPVATGLPCLHLNLSDDGKDCLTDSIIEQVLEFINNYNKVLVFCYAGMSRSVAVAISLIMYKSKLSYNTVLQQVRSVRPQADPSIPFTNFLIHWQQLHGLATPTSSHLSSYSSSHSSIHTPTLVSSE